MPDTSHKPSCAVIIPAFNEEQSIKGTLKALTRGMQPGEFEITVVCNGCVDQTAEVVRAQCPGVRVLETPVASKTAALNFGIAATNIKPIILLDADIKTSAAAVRNLMAALEASGCELAFGEAHFNSNQCSMPVREFYRAWQLNPYFDGGKVGGFFAVSEAGIKRLGAFPNITNDDEFVRRELSSNAKFVPAACYTVEPPRTLASLIKIRSRIYRGNRELSKMGVSPSRKHKRASAARFLFRLMVHPRVWPGALIFACVALSAHGRNKTHVGPTFWEQDQTARAAQS